MTDFLKIAKSIVVHFAHICAYGVETVKLTSFELLRKKTRFPDCPGKSQFPNILEFGCIGPGRCEYLTIDYQSMTYIYFCVLLISLASEISISSGYVNST